jgi:hypothetical protein
MTERDFTDGPCRAEPLPRPRCRSSVALALLFVALGTRSPATHEIIDTEGVNAMIIATDAAVTRFKSAAGSPSAAQAMFTLGMMQVEATAVLNRDLASHSGQLQWRIAAEGARAA